MKLNLGESVRSNLSPVDGLWPSIGGDLRGSLGGSRDPSLWAGIRDIDYPRLWLSLRESLLISLRDTLLFSLREGLRGSLVPRPQTLSGGDHET